VDLFGAELLGGFGLVLPDQVAVMALI